ncbi:MAG TPA: hypothetical protein VMB50_21215 [Myxococcales bacterium]|nr:hypothetical protein [Myxococcales bacterium]
MIRFSVVSLCVAWASSALAQTPPPAVPLQPEARPQRESALPQAGDVELVLEAPPILNSTNLNPLQAVRGLGVQTTNGNTTVGLGLNAGAGYYLSDVFEVGGAVAIDYGQEELNLGGVPSNSGAFEFGLEPFIKANFGRVLKGLHFSPFVQLGVIGGMATAPVSTGLFGFDLDLGVDFLISRGWGITAFIPLSLVDQTYDGNSIFTFGLGYGLVTYF